MRPAVIGNQPCVTRHAPVLPNVARAGNMICSAPSDILGAMGETPSERLREARRAAGFETADAFAKALGMGAVTYRAYETGQNGYAKHAPRFAAKLGTTAEWLLEGRGPEPSLRVAFDPETLKAVFETVLELSGVPEAKRIAASEVAARSLAVLQARLQPGTDPAQQARHTVLALWQ